ncbi:Rrf2 family protein [Clostridium tetanomorphum]|uniref:Rrf2 family transcriptional regulator n=1 Tax=Clostridium tetanomorphum TaxID=1553 RepID=A0A923ECL9_CLOTT|nr:Rrf2 family transcriptional regulator [Clostridium tetanomorphum]KAJ51852.1 RRF2 family protein [Clostridium tetanomorphum DSM 665]MBC2399502.1 Rrf2 family transcriptional regulator [Clostridium tetanomorphum]MBP1864145.1 Rrf2 family protein [Clostridium tetanomorphum]NRS84558.1 Rrf2 family protein [Clostridium tetanomorphum]NRZ97772.1 Rrf2 family protein [Clostridium tetanomorphum]
MKISTKGRYGLKAMIDVAVYSSSENVTLKSISERENISEKYLEQIFSALRKNGLVNSKKGAQGGYSLSDSMSKITAGDILRALEGSLNVVHGEEIEDDLMEKCIQNNLWDKLNHAINSLVDSITLEDLVYEYNKYKNPNYMYYI